MVKQLVNTGENPNDGRGDTLRVAFTKINSNMDELYTAIEDPVTNNSDSNSTTSSFSNYFNVDSIKQASQANGTDSIAIGPNSITGSSNSIVLGQNCLVNSTSNQCVLIGRNLTTTGSGGTKIGIGDGHSISGYNGIAIGGFNSITGGSAIGIGVQANASALRSVQIGKGDNSTEDTIQFRSNRLANNEGLYTSFTNPTNYTPSDTDNVTSHFQAIDVALSNAGGSFYRTNRENISANKQLQTDDPNVQLLKSESTGAITVNLPTSPAKDSYFLIASRKDSIGPINVNTIVLSPGDRLELIYDGTEWFSL